MRRRLRSEGRGTTAISTRGSVVEARYRQVHARLGVVLSLATLVEVAGYAWLGDPHADRATLLILSFGSALATVSVWWIGPAMARHRHHVAFFLLWSGSIVAIILFGTALDGGERSPIAVLLFLPMLFAALAYPPFIVLSLGVMEVVGYLLITYTDGTPNSAYAAVLAGTLTLTLLMALQSARNRADQARELHALTVRLEAEATRDGLTECLNRRGFDMAMDAEVSRAIRYARPMSLLLMDVDHLKAINDTRGHAGGDAALQEIAAALRQAGRPNDIAARFGGDEFALLVPETGIAGALKLAERIHAALRALSADGVPVTLSIGAATITAEVATVDDVLRAADGALYNAKRSGRDRTASFEDVAPPIASHDVLGT